ncbi:NfeD family protein [Porphyromonas sp.]|uniref:NfeD family protein n=1 Tax=Porphyromonas sp. TaxID=1924944 RepID=UPI0026DCFE9D|nr:NfeD family protein [Porphyromonas sp.]MDO4771464.1 NfeD family protein [Porphyromonas sp.]
MGITTLLILFAIVAIAVVVMGLIEIFFIPGTGLLGILAAAVYIATIIYLWALGQWMILLSFMFLTLLLFGIGFYFLSRSRLLDKISLSKSIDEKIVNIPSDLSVGTEGLAESRLALSGRVRIGDKLFEATSESGLIDEKTPIVISRIESDKVFVKKK